MVFRWRVLQTMKSMETSLQREIRCGRLASYVGVSSRRFLPIPNTPEEDLKGTKKTENAQPARQHGREISVYFKDIFSHVETGSGTLMSPPPLCKQSVRILIAIFNTPAWQRLSKSIRSVVLLLSRLFLRTLYRCRVFLNYWTSKKSPSEGGKGPPTLGEPPTMLHRGLRYTAIRDENPVPLGDISTSMDPSRRGSIGSNSQSANRSRPGSPHSGRLAPSNRSVTSRSDHPYSISHSESPTNSVHDFPEHGPTDTEMRQIERQDYMQSPHNTQRQDPEVASIIFETESPTSEYFTPDGPATEEEFDLDLPQASSPSIDGWNLEPMFPSENLRYDRRTKILKKDTNIILTPLDFRFETFPVPDGWTRHAHPEGCCYFYNKSKGIYTDAEIYDPVQLERIEEEIKKVDMAKQTLGFPTKAEIVLNLYGYEKESNSQDQQYFCMDHTRRVIFFFQEFHTTWVAGWHAVKGAFSKNQLRYELEAEYWYAVQMYPHRVALSKDMVNELRDIVLHLTGDTMCSSYSTSQFSFENLQKILSITSNMKENIGSRHTSGTVCALARFMYTLCHARFLNFHGESYGRLERDFSVYGDVRYPRTFLLRNLSLLLFSAPNIYRKNLQAILVDNLLHMSVLEETLKKISAEWQDLVTATTILLNANIAFLAIQSVDHSPPARSLAQIISYASVFTNVGGMISGLLLIRQYRDNSRKPPSHVNPYMSMRARVYSHLGIEGLAIMFSLPYALLMWGTILFLAAFALMCLDVARADTRITVGICLAFTGLLIAWFIFLSWESNEKDTSMEHRTLTYYPPDA